MLTKAEKTRTFSNAASHILQVTVESDRPVRVRRKQILAESGLITVHADIDGTESAESQNGAKKGGSDKTKRSTGTDAERAGQLANAGKLKAHLVSGRGDLYLGRNGGDVSIFSVVDDRVVLFAQAEVLAFADSLTLTLEQAHDKVVATVIGTNRAWVLDGTGHFATATSGETIVLDVQPDRPVRVETEAVLARTSGVELSKADDSDKSAVKRGAKQAINLVPGVSVNLGREKIWLNAQGTGQLIVRSSD